MICIYVIAAFTLYSILGHPGSANTVCHSSSKKYCSTVLSDVFWSRPLKTSSQRHLSHMNEKVKASLAPYAKVHSRPKDLKNPSQTWLGTYSPFIEKGSVPDSISGSCYAMNLSTIPALSTKQLSSKQHEAQVTNLTLYLQPIREDSNHHNMYASWVVLELVHLMTRPFNFLFYLL